MAIRIDVVRRTGVGGAAATVEFRPAVLHVPADERVFWCNLDPLAAHHISLFPNDPKYTLRAYSGEPPAMTPIFLVQNDISYSCIGTGHTGETGDIFVS